MALKRERESNWTRNLTSLSKDVVFINLHGQKLLPNLAFEPGSGLEPGPEPGPEPGLGPGSGIKIISDVSLKLNI